MPTGDDPKLEVAPETNVEAPPEVAPEVNEAPTAKPKAKKKKEPKPEPVAPKPTTAEALRVYALLTTIKRDVATLVKLVETPKNLQKHIDELWAAAREACPLVK